MKHRKSCVLLCFAICAILIVIGYIRFSSKGPIVSSQLFLVRPDGTQQEIIPTEQEGENFELCRNLMEDLENLEWVDEALVFCEYDNETPTYQVSVIFNDNDGDRFDDVLSWLNQYFENFSITNKKIYENQIQLTFVMNSTN